MKAVIYHSYDDICIENRPIPSIGEAELLVQVDGCGLCGSDILKIVQQAPPPVVLGHELTGTIVERGSTYSSSPAELRMALALLANHDVRVTRLISHRLPLEQFSEGVKLMREHTALKVYFEMRACHTVPRTASLAPAARLRLSRLDR